MLLDVIIFPFSCTASLALFDHFTIKIFSTQVFASLAMVKAFDENHPEEFTEEEIAEVNFMPIDCVSILCQLKGEPQSQFGDRKYLKCI